MIAWVLVVWLGGTALVALAMAVMYCRDRRDDRRAYEALRRHNERERARTLREFDEVADSMWWSR